MFVLDWTAYPFICLSVAVPMAVFYIIERRRESKADAAYDGPCMSHTGTDTDGTELWCWQRSGHEGEHDDYDREVVTWLSDAVLKIGGTDFPVPPFDPATNQYADLFAKEGYVAAPLIHHDPELTESHWTPGTDEV